MTTVVDLTRESRSSNNAAPRARLPRPKPVSVNGVAIPRAEIARETQHHPASKPIEAWQAAARALVVRELLLQEARRLRIVAQPIADAEGRRETDEEALVRQLVEQEVSTPEPDEATCRRIYEQKRASFRSSDLYAVRHVLIAASPGDRQARVAARARADAIMVALKTVPTSFADLAAQHSDCPSKTNGGSLGQISRGQTVPEFEAALAEAPVGELIEQPVETRYGFHIVRLEQRIDGKQIPFEVAREGIADWLAERSRHIAIRQYITLLASRAEITGIELRANASALAV